MQSKMAKQVAAKLAQHIGDREGLAQVADMFCQFDTDGTGDISAKEFAQGLRQYGVKLGEGEAEQLYTMIDLDKSG